MARLTNGPNGSIEGKFGSVSAYRWRGEQVIRSLPRKRTGPPTLKELTNRDKMRVMQNFLRYIIDFIRLGFKVEAGVKNMSAFNVAMSYNKKNAIQGEYPALSIDYMKLLVSKGTLPPPVAPTVSFADNTLNFTWKKQQDEEKRRDRVLLLAFYEDMRFNNMLLGGAYYSEGAESLPFPAMPDEKGLKIHSYVAFIDDMHDAISDSVYCGVIET